MVPAAGGIPAATGRRRPAGTAREAVPTVPYVMDQLAVSLTVKLQRATTLLRQAAGRVDELEPTAAIEVAALFAHAERVAQAATVRLARHVGDDGARRSGGSRDAASLLSTLTGSSVGRARASLGAAEQLASNRLLSEAFSSGALSVDQAVVIGPAATAAPQEASSLLDAAQRSGLRDLKREAERVKRWARGETAQVEIEHRIHARRFCRAWVTDDGGVRVDALLSAIDGARLITALEKETRAMFRRASGAGITEPYDRLRADALVELVTGRGSRVISQVLVRVDAAALRRGEVLEGEVCEIDGVGPVSVEHARSVIGDGFLTLLVRDGADIRTVTSTKRGVPRKVRMALYERDQGCVVPGCTASRSLETDHWRVDFGRPGPTELDNLCRLCPVHHRLKTRTGWRLIGGPGKWRWLPPRAGPLRRNAR